MGSPEPGKKPAPASKPKSVVASVPARVDLPAFAYRPLPPTRYRSVYAPAAEPAAVVHPGGVPAELEFPGPKPELNLSHVDVRASLSRLGGEILRQREGRTEPPAKPPMPEEPKEEIPLP
jgi:hypothetical protein